MASKILFNGNSIIPLLNNGKKSFAVAIAITGKSTGGLAINSFSINNGSIFSVTSSVSLDSVCTGSPTHYKASRFSDLNDAVWLVYSPLVWFELWQVGVNRIYFKVKNATEETETIYREIGWNGQEGANLADTVVIGSVGITEAIVVGMPNQSPVGEIADTVVIGSVDVSEVMIVSKNGVQVYP